MKALSPLLVVVVALALLLAVALLYTSHGPSTSAATSTAPSHEAATTAASAHGSSGTGSAETTAATARIPPGTYVVVLGDPRCPHCRAMEKFFAENAGSSGFRAYFCSVLDKVCADAFWRLYRLGATQGVPTIVACRGGKAGFIEVGELGNKAWWTSRLASMNPVEYGKIPVYLAGSLYKTINVDKELVEELCNTTLKYSKQIG